jgi:hypothetical protein
MSRVVCRIILAFILQSIPARYGHAADSPGAADKAGVETSYGPVYIWTLQALPEQAATLVASSSDGIRLVAARSFSDDGTGGFIYISDDSGMTWELRKTVPGYRWDAIASSSDGVTVLLAGCTLDANNNPEEVMLAISTDSGATWTEQTSAGPMYWSAVACSSDGAKLFAVKRRGYIYTSTDSGATWTEQTGAGSHYWTGVACSSDGTKLIAANLENIYESADSGATWTRLDSTEEVELWGPVASSSEGTALFAAAGGFAGMGDGYIYTSKDSGATWTRRTSSGRRFWNTLACSSDGTRVVAAGYSAGADYVYTSTDSGATWTQQTSLGNGGWSVWMSPDGSEIIAASQQLYTGSLQFFTPSLDLPVASSLTKKSAMLGATIQSPGSSPVTAAGIAYGPNPNPDVTGSTVPSMATSGSFQVHLGGLTPNTLYHFRGYATNSTGTGYTSDAAFTTISDAPTATASTGVDSAGFTANWVPPQGPATITGYRVDVATHHSFSSYVSGYKNLAVSGANTSVQVTGLISGETYYYRVRAVNAGETSANSNTVKVKFEGSLSVSLTSPSIGEKFSGGGICSISWTYTGSPGSVNIDLLLNGQSASTIASNESVGTKGKGSYAWTIPVAQTPGTTYQINISNASGTPLATSANFEIDAPTITVTSPSAGTKYAPGAKCPISWTYTGNPGNVEIDLEGNSTPLIIEPSTSEGSKGKGSYSWTIPKTQTQESGYTIKIGSTADSSVTGASGAFTISK